MRIIVNTNHPSTVIGDELAIVNYDTGSYILLNEVGAVIWEKISKREYTTDSLISEILDEYEVSLDECKVSVEDFLKRLMKSELVELK